MNICIICSKSLFRCLRGIRQNIFFVVATWNAENLFLLAIVDNNLGKAGRFLSQLPQSLSQLLPRIVEHLGLLVGKETLAARLLAHFGSLKALTKASACDLHPFMTTHKAERLVAALAVSAGHKLKAFFKNLSTLRKRFIDPARICRVSNMKCCGLFWLTPVFAGSLRLMSLKVLSTNHPCIDSLSCWYARFAFGKQNHYPHFAEQNLQSGAASVHPLQSFQMMH